MIIFVGVGKYCSLPAKIAVNRGNTNVSRNTVTVTAINAIMHGYTIAPRTCERVSASWSR